MYVCCLDVGFLRDVAGTTLTSRPFFGPDHKAIAPSSSFEGRSAPQKVRTASNQCQLVGWWVNWYFRIFRILQVYLPIDQFFDQFSLCSDHLRAFNWPWGTSSCPGWLRRHCIRALLDTQLRSKGSVVFTWHFCHVHSRAIFLLWTTDAHCQQLDQDPVRRQLLIPWLASRRGRWREVLARRAQRKPNILAVHKLCRFCTVLFCCPFCFRSSVIYLSCFSMLSARRWTGWQHRQPVGFALGEAGPKGSAGRSWWGQGQQDCGPCRHVDCTIRNKRGMGNHSSLEMKIMVISSSCSSCS